MVYSLPGSFLSIDFGDLYLQIPIKAPTSMSIGRIPKIVILESALDTSLQPLAKAPTKRNEITERIIFTIVDITFYLND